MGHRATIHCFACDNVGPSTYAQHGTCNSQIAIGLVDELHKEGEAMGCGMSLAMRRRLKPPVKQVRVGLDERIGLKKLADFRGSINLVVVRYCPQSRGVFTAASTLCLRNRARSGPL